LTINDTDFKINNNGNGQVDQVTVNSGAILNINQNTFGAGVAQGAGSSGALTINNGTVNWAINGTSESRFRIGNGPSATGVSAQGTVTLNGGSLNLSSTHIDSGDSGAGFAIGSDGGHGVLNLSAGTVVDSLALPFTLGSVYTSLAGSGTLQVFANNSGTINILNGTLELNAAYAPFNATKATFVVGSLSGVSTGEINFEFGTGSLSLLGWTSSDYEALATAGDLEVNGNKVSDLTDFSFSQNGDQGVLQLNPSVVPEPSSFALIGTGFLGLGCAIRRRHKASKQN
jgi:hypothetical protein